MSIGLLNASNVTGMSNNTGIMVLFFMKACDCGVFLWSDVCPIHSVYLLLLFYYLSLMMLFLLLLQ